MVEGQSRELWSPGGQSCSGRASAQQQAWTRESGKTSLNLLQLFYLFFRPQATPFGAGRGRLAEAAALRRGALPHAALLHYDHGPLVARGPAEEPLVFVGRDEAEAHGPAPAETREVLVADKSGYFLSAVQ